MPTWQRDAGQYTLFVHSLLPQNEIARIVRDAVTRVDGNLPKPTVHGLSDTVALALLPQRVASAVAGTLGALGLLLAGIGEHLRADRLFRGQPHPRNRRAPVDGRDAGADPNATYYGAGCVWARSVSSSASDSPSALALAVSGLVFGLVAGDVIAFAAAALVLTPCRRSSVPAGFPRAALRVSPMTALRHE